MGIFRTITEAIGGVAKVALPALTGFVTGGPIGAAIGGLGALTGSPTASVPVQVGGYAGGTYKTGPIKTTQAAGPLIRAGTTLIRRSGLAGEFGALLSSSGEYAGSMNNCEGGKVVTALQYINQVLRASCRKGTSYKRLLDAVRSCGIDAIANQIGVEPAIICQAIIDRPRRRRRGISAADLARTRSTVRKINSMQRQLKALAAGRRSC